MCKLKSGILLKDNVFIPDYDSHQKMLEELKIEDTQKNAETQFVRFEVSPENGDVFDLVDNWVYRVDQDILPDWYVEGYDKCRAIVAVKEWAHAHIFDGVDGLKISTGSGYYIRNCKDVEISGSATVEYIYGSSTVKYIRDSATVEKIYGSATVKCICDSATVKCICDSATVKCICDSATVERIFGSATVKKIYGSATVKEIYGGATVISSPIADWKNKKSVTIADNATFKDCYEKVIYQSGDWKFVGVGKE